MSPCVIGIRGKHIEVNDEGESTGIVQNKNAPNSWNDTLVVVYRDTPNEGESEGAAHVDYYEGTTDPGPAGGTIPEGT